MRSSDPRFAVVSALGVATTLLLCTGCGSSVPVTRTAVWLQTMDTCKQAIGGASYELTGGGITIPAVTPAQPARTTVPSARKLRCPPPAQQGDCVSIVTGCVQFKNVPVPGVYRIRQIKTPPPNATNPLGYAPCQGGSACRSQTVEVTIVATGVVQATVTNISPDHIVERWPIAEKHEHRSTYAGTRADPVVTHDFGLGLGKLDCDGDSDADDRGTGGELEHCQYPESDEPFACQPYPWSCTLPPPEQNTQSSSSGSPTANSSGVPLRNSP
jgi:hypothetical protein